MSLKLLLSGVSVACLLTVSAFAAEPLSPRVEVGVKGGTDRSLLTTEFWAPLAQKSDRVLYGDIRLMGDNDENREGNLGLGYRQIHDNAVLGVHGWIDRRRTQNNSTFHQLTFGVERLGHVVDARANVYVPLNQSRNITTPNIGQTSPYLAGTGIFFDTNGLITETPQYGLDGEVGYRIPVFQKHADAIRVYGGGYHFFRDETQDVTGFRVRTEAQINSAFSVGARFQHDGPRGSQGFLEATIKFPFGAKKLYQTDYLRARLDESPERDVDIVTASKVDTGLGKQVLNADGQVQRILYVDNSHTQAGDGSKENPFNTLKAAEAALRDNDILYVNHGTGTTTGMDQGVIINQDNVRLIGSGSALTYGGFTLLDAGLAPIITNLAETPVDTLDYYVGNGVLVTGSDAYISGITVNGSEAIGIRVLVDNKAINSVTVDNTTITNNRGVGLYAMVLNGGTINDVTFTNNIVSDNISGTIGQGHGIMARTEGAGSSIQNYTVSGNTVHNNQVLSVVAQSFGNADGFGNIDIENNDLISQSSGIFINCSSCNSLTDTITIHDNTVTAATGSVGHGVTFSLGANESYTIDRSVISNNTITGFTNNAGISLAVGTTGTGIITMTDVVIRDNNLFNNRTGITSFLRNSAPISMLIESNTIYDNNNNGITLTGGSTGTIAYVIRNNMIRNNFNYGISVRAADTHNTSISIENSTFTANRMSGIFLDNDTTGTYNANLGDGTAGSGNNRIFGNNTGNIGAQADIRLDLNGGVVSAQGNWWGQAGGPLAGRIVNEAACPSCGTADTSNALNTDPGV